MCINGYIHESFAKLQRTDLILLHNELLSSLVPCDLDNNPLTLTCCWFCYNDEFPTMTIDAKPIKHVFIFDFFLLLLLLRVFLALFTFVCVDV